MNLVTKDGIISILTNSSNNRILIGRYNNAVKQFLEYADTTELDKLQKEGIKGVYDADGNFHRFCFDKEQLLELNETNDLSIDEIYEVIE